MAGKNVCPGCGNYRTVYAKGMCSACYRRAVAARKMAVMVPIYDEGRVDDSIETVCGSMPYLDYLRKEMKRILQANPERIVRLEINGEKCWLEANNLIECQPY